MVEATPISDPQWIGKTKFEDLAIELSTTLTTPNVFILFFLQSSKAAKVSAVSPDWEMNIYKLSFKLLKQDENNSEKLNTYSNFQSWRDEVLKFIKKYNS